MPARAVVLVATGGALGAALRYTVGGWIAGRWVTSFPWHTFAINVAGSFLLGLLLAISAERGALGPGWRLFLGVGVLGGFTTFSTLSYESVALIERGLWGSGLANMFGSGVAALAAALAGLAIGRFV